MAAEQGLNGLIEDSTGEQQYAASTDPYALLDSVSASPSAPAEHLDQIWKWNASVPDPVQGCVHHLISEIAASQPDALAVCAWDGDFTYSQLEEKANAVARLLIEKGIAPKSSVPILFPKSKWTCVARLGVIKAGSSVVALDATQPDIRLRSIVQRVQPSIIISSAVHRERASELANVTVVQLDDALLETLDRQKETSSIQLPTVSPSDTVYISFTSGTTGQPKGACISHANVRSTVRYQGEKLGFNRWSRVFDFAPYSFDVSWSNFLHTLCAGGCLCIASEQDMLNNLSSAIRSFKVTLINITPTVLRTVSPIPPTLEIVLLSGEMPYRENITKWAGNVRLVNTYGPTECTFKAAFSTIDASEEGRPSIGRGVGFSTWIVDANDGDKLVSIGSVGELYLEGPQVGQGYLADLEQTASAFIKDPSWLLARNDGHPGRHGRLYKTGDLVKYLPDGRLLFVGRKDASQLKIRGQRVEIGDVEHHVRACLNDALQIIADVIIPRGSDTSSLALFVVVKDQDNERVKGLVDGLVERLPDILPGFMIPTIYFPVDEIPIAATGKVDRRHLRERGSALAWSEIVERQSTIMSAREYYEPSNDVERQLCQIWAEVLSLDATTISTADNFLRLGGDSIAAMRVVAAAREMGLSLTVADLFKTPILVDLAQVAKPESVSQMEGEIPPFSLLNGEKDTASLCEEAARICGVDIAEIEDVYPCTPLQEGMMALTTRSERVPNGQDLSSLALNYISRTAYELPGQIDAEQFEKAWSGVARYTPIIRTRIIDLPGQGLVQVVINSPVVLHQYQQLGSFLEDVRPMGLGTPLCRAALVRDDAACHFVLEMHHSTFDGWSSALVLDAVEAAYQENQAEQQPLAPLQPFIKHVLGANNEKAASFWQDQLAGSEAVVFPPPDYQPKKKLDLSHTISHLKWPRSGITPSSIVRSALTLLLASYTNSDEIKYGETLSGRQAPIAGIERIAGPTIATVPVRVKVDWEQTVEGLQKQIQRQAVEFTEHEQFGLQRIQRVNEDAEEASHFQLLLVIQPAQQGTSQKAGGLFSQAKSIITATENGVPEGEHRDSQNAGLRLVEKDGQADSMGIYNPYAMMIICQLEDSGLTFKVNFDSGAMEQKEVERFSQQLENILRQLCNQELAAAKVRDIAAVSNEDLADVWEWNRVYPEACHVSVPDMVDERAGVDPEAIAISSWDKQLTYQQLKNVTSVLARRLREEGVGRGSIVVLSFEKSAWLSVSMLSVLKAGGCAVPLSAPTSSERAHEIVHTLEPKLVITSSVSHASSFQGLAPAFSIHELIATDQKEHEYVDKFHVPYPSDPAVILFSSGSTGQPKSMQWSQMNLSTNIYNASFNLYLDSSSRVFQFAGYEFDVSTVESLAALSVGAFLFVPSESDRNNRLVAAINDSKANWLGLTPSVSETLTPGETPLLKTLVLAGEKLQYKVAHRWIDHVERLYNWYGPAETSMLCSCLVDKETWKPWMVGRTTAGLTWLVDPKNPNVLAPIGAVAELVVEGPIVSKYAGKNGPALNEKVLISPSWHPRGHGDVPGRTGTLYLSGDLVKYAADGRVIFISRRSESQRKLRGQRVELGEIELRVQSFLSGKLKLMVVAEIFCPANSVVENLALFVSPVNPEEVEEDAVAFIQRVLPVDEIETYLLSVLSSYMVPKMYIPLERMPTNHSGKTDRKRLRQIGSSLTYDQLAAMQPSRREAREPSSDVEKQLQHIWADIIGMAPDSVFATDNFFRLGGDSVGAMRLVAAALRRDLVLTVTDVFEAPVLENMATRVRYDSDTFEEEEIPPFSLLSDGISETESRSLAARACSVPERRLVDMYPSTALQQGLLALGSRRHGQYVSRSVLKLQDNVDAEKLQKAWLAAVEKLAILRTCIIDIPGQGLAQVVLDSLPMRSGSDLNSYLDEDEREPMGLGTELCRVAIVDRNFIFTIHHCTYDGSILQLILDEIESQYLDQAGAMITPYQNFIKHLGKVDVQETAEFWKKQLANSESRQFPLLPSSTYEPQANAELEYSVSVDWPQTGVTPSTIIRSAWSVLASQYTSSSDVMFGLTVSGRQANMRGLESCGGPTISTVPMAISIDWDESIESFLARLQRQVIEMTPYEQYGLQNIRRLHQDLDIQTLLVVQPVAEGKRLHEDSLLFKARSFSSTLSTRGTDPFNTYALMLICELTTSGLHLKMSFDDHVIPKKQMNRIALQFETIIRQFCTGNIATTKLDTVQTASDIDLSLIWGQNAQLPEESKSCTHQLIALAAGKQPEKVAIDAWDGQFSYQQVEELSTHLSHSLISLGVTKGSVIALCFEKSKWTAIAQLAVLKAGAVTLLQSVAVPDERIGKVFKNVGVQLVVASESRVEVVSKYARCFTIDELSKASGNELTINLPVVDLRDSAAIMVSSGSTGEPKQILWSHRNMTANVKGHGQSVSMNESSRVFQFSSYDFDVSTVEVMSTLVNGGCLCIPSESERVNDMSVAISRFGATYLGITPSAVKLLRPEDVPSLSVLVLAGENFGKEEVNRWRGKCHVINWYGPAEGSSTSFCAADTDTWYSGVIGRVNSKNPSLCWLIDPRNHNRLVPFGAVGEIALEGPLCAQGYIGNPELTGRVFCKDPSFLSFGQGPEKPGRHGRIYRTGDLARYDARGDLVLLGRRDTQLKIRGQLVAPAEVENQIRQSLALSDDIEVVVDALVPKSGENLTLVAFITLSTQDEVEKLTTGLNEKLKTILPAYAVPSYYIPVSVIPTTATGKRDRTRLLEIGSSFDPPRQLSGSTWREPATTAERTLQKLWSLSLGVDSESISASDSFLRLGDSIQAMRLVGIARRQGLLLTVAEIFQHPILADMANRLKNREDVDEEDTIGPCTLLAPGQDIELARSHAASEGLLALTMKRQGDYTGRNVLKLDPSVDIARFKEAWEKVVQTIPILRTRIIDLSGQGLVQVVIRVHDCWTKADSVDDYLGKEKKPPMGLGAPLMRCGLFPSSFMNGSTPLQNGNHTNGTQEFYFALTMHHSIYDGLTTPLILETLENIYNNVTPLRHSPFQSFVKYLAGRDKDAEAKFWETQFEGLEAAQFPALPSSTYQPQTDSTFTHSIEDVAWRADDITPSTVIRSVFALLCSQYSNTLDVVFGTVVAGRKAPVGGIERLAGPTIATLPIRVKIDGVQKVEQLLATLQNQATEMIPYEQTGLSALRQISDEAQQACQFQTLLVIQPGEENIKDSSLFVPEVPHGGAEVEARRYFGFNSYALSVICTLEDGRLKMEFCFDSAVIEQETIHKMAEHFEHLLGKLCTQGLDEAPISDVNMMTDQDLNQVWGWNSEAHQTVEKTMHSLITEIAQAQPDAVAISAWDGEITYRDLDRFSDKIAHHLVELGVGRNIFVPLCFEKSLFTMVGYLGVIKAGGAGVLFDPAVPESRLKAIVEQVKPKLIICSPTNKILSSKLVSEVLVLSADSDVITNENTSTKELPYVDPSDLMYAVFTSGSTGTPKGCLTQHRHFTSAVTHQRTLIALDNTSRVYDFSSYTFDAVYWSAFHTLTSGGTLCIPSEVERKSDLTESIRRFKTTDIFFTPSTSRLVDPSVIPTLRNFYVGGEVVTRDDVARWMPYANTIITYGPSECSAITVYWKVPSQMPSKLSIGQGIGVSGWIVDPRSSDKLSPIGTVGELYLEGPLVGQGYLGDETKTAASFIEDPEWLAKGSPDSSVPGRRGRLYKTGDLVKYNPADGTLTFVERKDTQVKLRGQRIELSEVEHHVRQGLTGKLASPTAIAEVIVPTVTGRPTLVVFVQVESSEKSKLNGLTDELDDMLHQQLPVYMVPAAYIEIESMPLAPSANGWVRGLANGDAQLTESELSLQQLWITVLGVPAEVIHKNSSFLRLGGDSISAMRLSALALSRGVSLTVQIILQTSRLSEMASAMSNLDSNSAFHGDVVVPFSLLKHPESKDKALSYIAKKCDIDASNIEDVFPCTGVQKSLLSMTAKSENSYVARFLLQLRDGVDVDRLKQAWESVSQTAAPILRSRIVDVPTEGLVQVLVNGPLEWDVSNSVETYLKFDQNKSMGLGKSLSRLAIVGDSKTGGLGCIFTQHHAIYDGHSLDLLFTEVSKTYAGVIDDSPVAPFQAFIKHVMSIDDKEASQFWSLQFADLEAAPFPSLPKEDYQPKADSTVRRHLAGIEWPKRDATASTTIRAAWSILTARYTDSSDVVFGSMVTGRQAPIAGIDRMIAPLINAIPVRVKFDPKQSVDELLSEVQKQSVAMIAYEHTELLDIRRINSETERGSRFNTLLVVQPAGQGSYMDNDENPFQHQSEISTSRDGLNDFNPNAVMVMCQLKGNNKLELEISFDSNVMDAPQMERLAAQFEQVLRQITTSTTQTIEEIETISEQDIKELWNWNALVPSPVQKCIHELIDDIMKQQPNAPAVCAWDGDLTYAELDNLSLRLALHLVTLGVGPGSIIPLCFQKSMWYPVAALGAIRAGATCVAMDSTQPESRLRSIVNQVNAKLILSSVNNEALANQLSDTDVVLVDQNLLDSLTVSATVSLPKVTPSDVLYVVFTSGSTGVPKGIVTTHENFASAATHQEEVLNIRKGTRVFDFVSYSFDVSWSNHLQTLICGGCLCIPSESERKNDIAGAFNRMNCDYVYFTPSVARSLNPASMPGIRTLAMGGEPIQTTEVARWTQAETIIGIYGPAECAQALSFAQLIGKARNNYVGYSFGAKTWLVQPGRLDRLAGVGTIGELLIEGPTVSKGYFGELEKTKAAYIQDPVWLSQGAPGHTGRHGTLYKTGDLLRYNSDGSMDFIGRKDGLIKLRGQRIELEEVEYHVRACLSDPTLCAGLAAEIIKPQNGTSPILVVFLSISKELVTESEDQTQEALAKVMEGLEERLVDRVPQYMVPGAYIHIDKIPMTTTNKTDRKSLREIGNAKTLEQLAELQSHGKERRAPSSVMEKRLQALWSSVLEIDAGSISAESSFLRIGGESIAAMRLVAAAREECLSLTVAQIFKAPRLADLALLVSDTEAEQEVQSQEPFSLLRVYDTDAFLQKFVAPVLETSLEAVQDTVPATDFQERSILDALQDPPGRYPHWIFDLPADVDFARLEESCYKLVDYFEVLRTVFVRANGRFWQVLLSNFKPAYDTVDANDEDINSFTNTICEQDLKRPRRMGHSFLGAVLQTLSSIYTQQSLSTTPSFGQYITFNEMRKDQSLKYWASRLQGSSFPSWGSSDSSERLYSTEDRLNITETMQMPDMQHHEGITRAIVFHAACAIALSRQFQQSEVVFGRLVTGRSMLPSSLQNVVGPCMTEVPIRISIDANSTLVGVATQLREQFIEDSTYEAAGMIEIIRNCTEWPEEAKDFGWRTALQQEDEGGDGFTFLGSPSKISHYERDLPARTRPEIYATPRGRHLELEFEGNKKLTPEATVRDFFAQLRIILTE
ncbi:Nonribosomal peptide synthetase GRA1 [Cladobotryum mycophilum]|uniref:Nonribosomal peptide synthetase GRA1 n=1 Tax=Cladobotryum mycophilum TaxID=491253 RepID=A0ABR0SQ16_9HYPO